MLVVKAAAFASLLVLTAGAGAAETPVPDRIAAPGYKAVLTLHAEGAQIYECRPDGSGQLVWTFREPIATLLADGKTVGRHYAGPNWDYSDGSGIQGIPVSRAPGASSKDISWLKLRVVDRRPTPGVLSDISMVQRINTTGGRTENSCTSAGAYLSSPYSADYVFLRKD